MCLLPWLEENDACPCFRVVMVSDEELIEEAHRLHWNCGHAEHPPVWKSQPRSAEITNIIFMGNSRHADGTMEDAELGPQQT